MTTPQAFGEPPRATRKNHEHSHHGIVVQDPYAWLQDPDYPTVNDQEVLDYLRAENAVLKKLEALAQAKKKYAEEKGIKVTQVRINRNN